jgi:hypothetical protein
MAVSGHDGGDVQLGAATLGKPLRGGYSDAGGDAESTSITMLRRLAIVMLLCAACGPNAAPTGGSGIGLADRAVTPVVWRPVPTSTPGPPTRGPVTTPPSAPTPLGGPPGPARPPAAPTAMPPPLAPGAAQPQVGTVQLTATPAISSRSVLPPATPTNVPLAQCRFGNDVVSVPLRSVISPPPRRSPGQDHAPVSGVSPDPPGLTRGVAVRSRLRGGRRALLPDAK